ncbi:MAG: hypothetical protein ACRDGM_01720, partial [bacterium]
MAIDDMPKQEPLPMSPEGSGQTLKFALVFVVLAALAVGEIYTLSRIGTIRESLEAQQAALQKTLSSQVDQQLSAKITALEYSNAQQFDALRKDLATASRRTGPSGKELRKARAMVEQLQNDQREQA